MGALYQWYRQLLRNPRSRTIVILGTLLYLVSPIDISPDLVPLLGQLDDAVLVTLLLTEAFQWISDRLRLQSKSREEEERAAAEPGSVVIDVEATEVDSSQQT